jgi:hypothetical protein
MKRLGAGMAIAVAAALLSAPAAGAVSADLAISNLNAQRKANKLPAGIVHNPLLSEGCAMHNNYMKLNNLLAHEETPGSPGFTAAGQLAGSTSVLAVGSGPWDTRLDNPWEVAPIHLAQTLDPALANTGYDESFSFSCMTTLGQPLRPAPASLKVYTYPGPNTKIYAAEIAAEGPYTPGELVGIPKGATTGPYIYVFVDGPNRIAIDKTRITAASLRSKKGRAIKLKRVDGTNPNYGLFTAPGGILIPPRRLKAGKYQASVSLLTPQGERLKRQWSFRAK